MRGLPQGRANRTVIIEGDRFAVRRAPDARNPPAIATQPGGEAGPGIAHADDEHMRHDDPRSCRA